MERVLTIEIIKPENREAWLAARKQDVTASVAGGLLGVHPYTSALDIWAEKTGRKQVVLEENDPVLRRGRIFEYGAIDLIREDFPEWKVTHSYNNRYFRDTDLRMGCTPDAFVRIPGRPGEGIVQIKTVSDYSIKAWRNEEKQIEPPLWVAVQASVEAHLTGAKFAYVALLHVGHGLNLYMEEIPLNPKLMDRIRNEVAAFWRLIADKKIPDPDYGKDSDLIEELYKPVDGKIIDLSKDNELPALLDERAMLAARGTADDKRKKEIKAALLFKLGDANIGKLADGRTIVTSTVTVGEQHRKAYSFLKLDVKKDG